MGELPLFTAHAHVFAIDPKTKKTWIPSSTKAVEINYFFDPTKNCFRIVSIEDTNNGKQVIINSTLTEKMVFKKTSQKFGQWTDSKQCTIFGLGFNSEDDLDGFVDQFKTCIDSMRSKSAQNQAPQDIVVSVKDPTKRELLGLNNNVVVGGSGRQWPPSLNVMANANSTTGSTVITATSPNVHNNNNSNPKVASLELELDRMTKRYEELKLQHQEELRRMRDELDNTNTGALVHTMENFKNTKDLRTRLIELENENKELKKKVKELSDSKTLNQISSLMNVHQQMDATMKQLSSYHYVIGQKLSDILTSQPVDLKPPTAYGL